MDQRLLWKLPKALTPLRRSVPCFLSVFLLSAGPVLAAGDGNEGHGDIAVKFLWIALILIAARLASIIERWGQPAVLGELIAGIILGNLGLAGIGFFKPVASDPIISFLAELGVVILLFQIGLESNIHEMKRVGGRAFAVAVVGVVMPFLIGMYLVEPLFLPGLQSNSYLFVAATLTATSVGITARVFQDLGRLGSPEARIVLGAAVIDDVLGLIILAVVKGIVEAGDINAWQVLVISLKALGFLGGALLAGQLLVPPLVRFFSRISSGAAMKFSFIIAFGLIFAYLAYLIGLAPIVGAFAAGLLLDRVYFESFDAPELFSNIRNALSGAEPAARMRVEALVEHQEEKHIEHLIAPVGHFLVPIFFVVTGMTVRLDTLANIPVVLTALGISAAAISGKIMAGLAAGKVRRWVVGWGMVPRGEVGLIFAAAGKALNVIPDEVYSVIVIMVILTTLVTPPILSYLIRRQNPEQRPAEIQQ